MSQYLKRNFKTPLPKPPYPGSRLGGRHQINRAPDDRKLPDYNGTCRTWQCLLAETLLRISTSDVLV